MKSYSSLIKYDLDSDTTGMRMNARVPVARTRYFLDGGKLEPYFDTLTVVELYSSLEMIQRGLHVKWFSRGYR